MSHSTKIYSTVPVEVTKIGDKLNEIATNIARNPKIESITGSDFIVYLTYSYNEHDVYGWIASSLYGLYQGTYNDAQAEMENNIKNSHFCGASWWATQEEAEDALQSYEDFATQMKESTEAAFEQGDQYRLSYGSTPARSKKWYERWLL